MDTKVCGDGFAMLRILIRWRRGVGQLLCLSAAKKKNPKTNCEGSYFLFSSFC